MRSGSAHQRRGDAEPLLHAEGIGLELVRAAGGQVDPRQRLVDVLAGSCRYTRQHAQVVAPVRNG
jgi:hypothetical protein